MNDAVKKAYQTPSLAGVFSSYQINVPQLNVNIDRIKELQPMMKGEYVVILNNRKQLTMTRGIRDLQQALGPG